MHYHHFVLRRLAELLTRRYAGERLLSAFSQNKNELVLEWEKGFLRVGCHTPLTYVVPVAEFSQARKNVVELFESMRGITFLKARVVPYERTMVLEFADNRNMVLKLHGAMANVLLREGDRVDALFNQERDQDWEFVEMPGPYHPELLEEADAVALSLGATQKHLQAISPIYDRQFARKVLAMRHEGVRFADALDQVEAMAMNEHYTLRRERRKIRFYLFPPPTEGDDWQVEGVGKALMYFLGAFFQYDGYLRHYHEVRRTLQKPVEKFRKVHDSYAEHIAKLETERSPEELGHLLMANLHAVEPGQKQIELSDFYTGQPITISLKPTLSPQENAERYYEKAKGRKGKLRYLREQLDEVAAKRDEATETLEEFLVLPEPEALPFAGTGFDSRALREFKKELLGFYREQKQEQNPRYPFRHYRFQNYDIFVGRNAQNNDLLSMKFANKEDIWLHAKDVHGSHVVVRTKPGHSLPEPVLEYAAGLAAYFSKRRNDGFVPVQYTPRKYLRKRKGDPPGLVVVERESVIMAEPIGK